MVKLDNKAALESYIKELQATTQHQDQGLISLCSGPGCIIHNSDNIRDILMEEMEKHGIADKYEIRLTGCHGYCQQGPIMVIDPGGIFYPKVKPENIPEIVEKTLAGNEPVEKFLFKDPASKKAIIKEVDIPFYKLQTRSIFGKNRFIAPGSIDNYL